MRGLQALATACLFSTALFAADNPFVGTWKLNAAKSKFAPGTELKEMTVTFEAVGNEMKRTVSGIDPDGQQINQNSTIAWDGKAHKIEAPPNPPIMVAVKKVGDHTLDVTVKQPDGKLLDTVKARRRRSGEEEAVERAREEYMEGVEQENSGSRLPRGTGRSSGLLAVFHERLCFRGGSPL